MATGFQKVILAFLTVTLFLMTLVSMGLVGQQITYINDFQTRAEKDYMKSHNKVFINSMNSIMAFNVFFLIFVPFLIYGSFN